MRVFVTGATGFVGTAVVRELRLAGHQVVGLVRSDKAADALEANGAEVHRGALDDLGSLREGAAAADGVIHLAFIHDFTNYAVAAETDKLAIEAMGSAIAGTGKPFIGTSGTLMLPQGRLGTEEDAPGEATPRQSEAATMALVDSDVRASIVRLAPSVHGPGDHGFIKTLIDIAKTKGVSAYIEEGTNRWSAVHRLDAARLFRLAVESAPAGTRLHGVGDESIPFRDIAAIIGRHLNLPVVSISREEAAGHFSWLTFAALADNPTSSALTQQLLGWRPEHMSLLQDLEEGHYFQG